MPVFTVSATVMYSDGRPDERVTDVVEADDWAEAFINFTSSLTQEDPSIRGTRMSKPELAEQ